MKRILGIDYGDIKIGVAVSDLLGITAQKVETIMWKEDVSVVLDRVEQLCKTYSVDKLVIGYPKNMNGTIGVRGEKTHEFVDLLKSKLDNKQYILWDERLTTSAAKRTMFEMKIKKKKKKGLEDQIAAVYLLQGYLDSL